MLFEKDRFTKIRFAEIQTTMKKFQRVLDDYSNETESKKNHYNYLKMRDEANTASIEENNKRIHEFSVSPLHTYIILFTMINIIVHNKYNG